MEKLKIWIKTHSKVKDFLAQTSISRTHYYHWCNGERRLSLQLAAKIVEFTRNEISFQDLVEFERSFDEE